MKFRTSLDPREAAKGVRTIKDLLQRHWHLDSVGLGNCRAAQAILRELNEQLLIQSAALANANFNSDEPRDRYGQWTTGGVGGVETNSPGPAQPVKSGETSQSTASAGQAHTLSDEIKAVTEHATRNPFLRQLLQRALRVLTTFGPNSAGMKELSGLSKAIVADVAAEMMHAPEFGGNIRAFILGKEMPVDQALRDSALEQQFRGETPTATVAGKLSENLTETLPMILAMRGLPVGVQKILTTIFTAKMLKDAPGIAKQLIEEFHKPAGQRDSNKIDSLVADAIEMLGFTALGMFGSKESSKGEPGENPANTGESKYSEPATLPKPEDAPDDGAVYARRKGGSAGAATATKTQVEDHHIGTSKNWISTARGGPWSPRFEPLYKKAGMTLEDFLNRIPVGGHGGPHPEAYHSEVYNRLRAATKGLSGDAYTKAFKAELAKLANEAKTPGTKLNKLITR